MTTESAGGTRPTVPDIRDRTIICVASDWQVDPTSKHHIMQRLARQNAVLWVSYHGTRRPRINRYDARLAATALMRVLRGPGRVGESFVHLTPLVIPGTNGGPLGRINRHAVVAQIRRGLRHVDPDRRRPVQLWTFAPDVGFLAGRFGEERLVYYCVDEHAEFAGVDRDALRAAERRLLYQADVVFASSRALFESKSALHPNVHYVPHGVDVEHFSRAVNGGLERPADVRDLSEPVIGFIGLVREWVDVELIAQVAARLPQTTIVIIGDVLTDVSALRRRPNVRLLGRRPYETLPAYCAVFDVGIVPFRCDEMTRHINPIKLREYLAAGLPVVSTRLPEVQPYVPEVSVASDAPSFALSCQRACGQNTVEDRARRNRRVCGESWDHVVERIMPIVMNGHSAGPPGLVADGAFTTAARVPQAGETGGCRACPGSGGSRRVPGW